MRKVFFILPILFFLSVSIVLACEPSVTPTQDPTPTIDPCVPSELVLAKGECITPTPEVTDEPTATPSATVTVEPSSPPASHGDGLSDGRSSCPECTKAPVIPYAAPATGRAL